MRNKKFLIPLLIALTAILCLAGIFYWQSFSNDLDYRATPSLQITPETLPAQSNAASPSPSPTIPLQTPKEISSGNANKKQIIFTFDFGSGNQSGQKILEVLKDHDVRGTFFTTSRSAEQNARLIEQIAKQGHEIFNHTHSHPHLTQLTDEEIRQEFKKCEDIVFGLTGHSTKPYFRPPYGERDERVLRVAAQEGYQSVFWTKDAGDWITDITPQEVKQRIYSSLKNGAIILMHVGDEITGQILDEVFTQIEQQGYKIVGLTEGLK